MPDEKKEDRSQDNDLTKLVKGQQDQIQELMKSLKMLGENQGRFLDTISDLQESIAGLRTNPEKEKKTKSDVNLEALSRTEFLDAILDKVGGLVDDRIKPVSERVQDVDDRGIQKDLQRQIRKAAEDHLDFGEWREEMGNIAKRSPGLAVEEYYQLARLSDPDKASKMDGQYKTDEQRKAEEKEAEEKAKEKEPRYGGLTPTSGKTVEVNDMTLDEAAEKSFDDIFGPEPEK